MEKRQKIIYAVFTSMVCLGGFLFLWRNVIIADNLNMIVISEIQISGESANDEFIELYNPTAEEVDLAGWDIKKKTKTGSVSNIVTDMTGTIPASSYFLIAPRANCGEAKNESCYKGNMIADGSYTTNNFLAKDNALLVFDKENNLIDLVGWGEAADFEGKALSINPDEKQSLERKREGDVIMISSNNQNDFFIQGRPNPQNSKMSTEIVVNDGNKDLDENKGGGDLENGIDQGGGQTNDNSSTSQENGSPKIIITEFLLDPEDSDRDNEFIEIYNGGDRDEGLGGWSLEDRAGKIVVFTFPEKTIIEAGAYKEFYSDETKISLNNSGDGVILKNSEGSIVSEVPVSGSATEEISFSLDDDNIWKWTERPTPGRKNIIVYDEPKSDQPKSKEAPKKSKTEEQETGEVKGEKMIAEASRPYDFSDGIMITEIFPNPSGMDNKLNYEWVEIYNNTEEDINLRGWQIDDILKKGSKSYVIKEDKIIKKGTSLVLSNEETKIALNNSEDEVNLLWPDGVIVDSIEYAGSKEGWSYAVTEEDKWIWTSAPTPEKKNIITNELGNSAAPAEEKMAKEDAVEEEDKNENLQVAEEAEKAENKEVNYVEADLEGAKKMARFTSIRISGIVSAPPGIFSDNSFYISGSGMQIFSYKENFSGISIGDKIEALGSISEIGGEKRLLVEKNADIKVLSHDNLLEPKIVSTGDVGEKYEGSLIVVEGRVSGIKSDVFYVDDGSGESKVYIKPQTKIVRPEIKINDPVVITGEVSRTSLGYRILPRFQGDIRKSKTSSASTEETYLQNFPQKEEISSEREKENIPVYGYVFAVFGLLILVDWGRMKIKK